MGVTRVLLPFVVAAVASVGVAVAHNNPENGPVIVAIAGVIAVGLAALGERGPALAAIGVGAAGAFVAPNGLGPLIVATGVIVTADVGGVDSRVTRWRSVIEAVVCLPAFAGLAGTIASLPSQRGIAVGVAAALALALTIWRDLSTTVGRRAVSPTAYLAVIAALPLLFAPDRITAFGNLPPASVTASRSAAAALAVFAVAVLADVLWAERRLAR